MKLAPNVFVSLDGVYQWRRPRRRPHPQRPAEYVPSTTLTESTWQNTHFITGDVEAAVRDLKAQPGRDLLLQGSGNLLRSLLERDLVDELTLIVPRHGARRVEADPVGDRDPDVSTGGAPDVRKARRLNHARRAVLAAAMAIGLVSAACAGSASSTVSPTVSPKPTAATSVASSPAPTVASAANRLVVGGDRPVDVHVPATYDASRPAPLLILLHGFGGSGEEIDDFFGLATAAEDAGYVYATPDGTRGSDGNRFWNATNACCDFEDSGVDDVAYLEGVIADIQAELAIDPRRIAVAGWSNGGFMSYRMACERADLVAAIVSLAGTTFADPAACKPSEPVSVAHIHGTADDVIRVDGGVEFDDPARPYPGARATARAWATYDGCDPKASSLAARIDVDVGLTYRGDPAETLVEQWSGCDAGAAVQLWTIPDGSHGPTVTPAFADSVIDFLVEHPKRPADR